MGKESCNCSLWTQHWQLQKRLKYLRRREKTALLFHSSQIPNEIFKSFRHILSGTTEADITPLNVIIICAALLVALIVMVWLAV
jgi:hypothetical protein